MCLYFMFLRFLPPNIKFPSGTFSLLSTATHTLCVPSHPPTPPGVSHSYLPPHPQSAVCIYERCVVAGVWCTHSQAVIQWQTRSGKKKSGDGVLLSSGHAAHPQLANQRRVPEVGKVQGTCEGTLWYRVTHRPRQHTSYPNSPNPPSEKNKQTVSNVKSLI